MPREVGGRPHHDEAEVARDGYGDHVPVDHFAKPDPRVVSLCNDVEGLVADEQVEMNVLVRGDEAREQRPTQEALGGTRNVEAKRAAGLVTELTHRGDGGP